MEAKITERTFLNQNECRTNHWTRGGNSDFVINLVFETLACVVAVSARVNAAVMLLPVTHCG
jgi:hypothetical protein